jgi:hypothetical protein
VTRPGKEWDINIERMRPSQRQIWRCPLFGANRSSPTRNIDDRSLRTLPVPEGWAKDWLPPSPVLDGYSRTIIGGDGRRGSFCQTGLAQAIKQVLKVGRILDRFGKAHLGERKVRTSTKYFPAAGARLLSLIEMSIRSGEIIVIPRKQPRQMIKRPDRLPVSASLKQSDAAKGPEPRRWERIASKIRIEAPHRLIRFAYISQPQRAL